MGECEVGALKVHPFITDTAFNSFLVRFYWLSTFNTGIFPFGVIGHEVICTINETLGKCREIIIGKIIKGS